VRPLEAVVVDEHELRVVDTLRTHRVPWDDVTRVETVAFRPGPAAVLPGGAVPPITRT